MESTPLAPRGAAASPQDSIAVAQDLAGKVFTKENAEKAGTFMKERTLELRQMASDGDLSLRLLAMLGGIAMVVTSVMGFIGHVFTLAFVKALLEIYTFFLGIVVLVLEGRQIPFPRGLEQGINKYALFLKFVWGRGCLYFVAGSLQLAQYSIVDLAVGGFMCFVGAMYIIVGRQTAQKLAELRKSVISEDTLKMKFLEADIDRTGTLTQLQFTNMTRSIGIELNRRETESAFLQLGKSGENDQLTYDEFKKWWNQMYDDDDTAAAPTSTTTDLLF